MLKLSEHAIGMLISKYRAVLKRMLIRNTAAFAACCVIFGAPAAGGAAGITYTGDGADLQTAPIGGASSPSLIPTGVSGNTVTVDYTTGTDPWRVFGGLSDSAAVIGNTVYLLNGTVNNNFYGGYDAAGTGGFGAGNNTVTISGGTVISNAVAGLSLQGDVAGNRMTMSGGTVGRNLYGGSANGSGSAVGNSVLVTGGQVGDGLGDVGNGWVVGGFSQDGLAENNRVTLTAGMVNSIEGGESVSGVASNNTVTITGGTVAGVTVRGGFSSSGLVTGNSVAISAGSIAMDVMGGQSNSGNVVNNQVTFTGGTIGQFITGGFTDDGDAAGNRVIVSGGEVTGLIRGGFSVTGKVEDNQVMFSGSKASSIEGGVAMASGGNVAANTVHMSGGEIAYNVYGGITFGTGSAADNNVLLTGGQVNGDIYGGFSNSSGSASGNNVLLTGGQVNGNVYGGFSGSGSASNNSITLGRDVQIAGMSSIFGGLGSASSGGNTLNLDAFKGSVREVNGFQNYNFFLPASLTNGGTVLTVTNQTDLAGTHVAITGMEGGILLAPGNTVTLISSTQNAPGSYTATNVRSGISILYDFSLEAAGTALTATVKSAGVNPQTKALVEGYAANMAFVNQGADLAGGTGMADAIAKAKAANGNIASFGAVSSGSSRYKTGSHADVDGTSLMTGFVTKRDIENGSLVKGLFLEAGRGNYDTYNSFANMPSVRGDGDTSYYGLGALLRHDTPDGRYLEGSVRGGKSRTTFGSGDLNNASYTTNSGYYGAHIGIGKLKTEGGKTVDYYAKYFWTHQNGSDVRVAGEPFSFAGVDSSRLRGGVRLSQEKPDGKRASYVGLAYEYEFDGKAKGSVYGLDLEAPSLKGGTGIVELGMSFKSRPASSNTLELGLQGYAGKREGVTGTVQLKRVF